MISWGIEVINFRFEMRLIYRRVLKFEHGCKCASTVYSQRLHSRRFTNQIYILPVLLNSSFIYIGTNSRKASS